MLSHAQKRQHIHADTKMEISFISRSDQDTIRLGRLLGEMLEPGTVIGLIGDLGAGKTCFMKGLAYGVNRIPEHDVTSPTFTILQEYAGAIPLYHVDAYRLSGPDDLETIGLDEYIGSEGIVVVEWADRIADALPDACLMITIAFISEHERRFTCTTTGTHHRVFLEKFRDTINRELKS